MLAAAANPALANEAAPLAGHEPMAVPASSGGQDRVFVAQPVGQVSVGLESGDTGRRMFAARSQAGSASMVSFSATRPRPVILGTPGTMGTMGTMGAPLSRASLTSSFGARRPAANGGSRAHAGVDLAAPTGSPVTATQAGRVSSAGWAGGYGNLVVVQHGNGVETRYAHLSRIGVVAGQQVSQGQVLGLVGSTGHSTGPHLHYELRQYGRALNPLK